MGFKRNQIPDNEYKERMDALMPGLEGIKAFESTSQVTELFTLYNDRLTPRKKKQDAENARSTY